VTQLIDLGKAIRPKQWTKNLIIFLPMGFSLNLFWGFDDPLAWNLLLRGIATFVLFCAISSGIYLINDLVDIESDRAHPEKRLRPIASGRVGTPIAIIAASILLGLSVAIGFSMMIELGLVMLTYMVLMVLYSFYLKRVVIIDVGVIAAGFVIRVVAGASVISVPVSPWLYICTIFGALFIGFAKRRNEMKVLEGDAVSDHRDTLQEYSLPLLDQLITIVVPSTLIAYSVYAATADVPRQMMMTVPFIVYGLFRYLFLVHSRDLGGKPEEILLGDKPLLVNILLWAMTSGGVLFIFR
jgi:4-hydroxybenzoate polyprenyltransferase